MGGFKILAFFLLISCLLAQPLHTCDIVIAGGTLAALGAAI